MIGQTSPINPPNDLDAVEHQSGVDTTRSASNGTATPIKLKLPFEKDENAPEKKSQGQMSDVSLRFKIDDQTHDLTILILDRASRKVVRTIPPDEIQNLKPGDLLELFA
jgi:FlaG protein